MTPEYVSPGIAAKMLNTSRMTVWRCISEGTIPAINVGKGARPRYLIHTDTIKQQLARPLGTPVGFTVAA